ncbi:MAG: AAA family ATPase [Dehalococcoidia bacterium]|nr:AAA family ATPase [Dehalococcoidia bacterium]
MFESLRIRNYRVFSDLEISDLSRINLIGGKNNSGKSSLLEAIFLLASGGNAMALLNVNIVRELAAEPGSTRQAVNILWKPIFHDMDMRRPIAIEGYYSPRGSISLEISSERIQATSFPIKARSAMQGTASTADLTNEHSLKVRYANNGDTGGEGFIVLKGQDYEVRQDTVEVPFNLTILKPKSGNVEDDAIGLGRLRQQKRGDLLLDALRVMEPRLQSIEDNSASGVPMIWGDIGLSELVPLPVMGDGMTRLARLILATANCPGGVVLVDEVENGIHHSIMSKVWKTISIAAERFDTQIFATTHSYECIEKAYEALGAEGFRFHRVRSQNARLTPSLPTRSVTYTPEMMETAISHNMEIR